jgi:hypothetical protein
MHWWVSILLAFRGCQAVWYLQNCEVMNDRTRLAKKKPTPASPKSKKWNCAKKWTQKMS